ncbi:MAG: Rieske 2Fe-2S domain-containing protein [Terracidiphilus sp.]
MATSNPGMVNPGGQAPASIPRRGFIEVLLGAGFLATAATFLYPVLRYFIPPPVANLGVDEVVAAKVGDLRPNSGMIFPFGSVPGLLILEADGTYRALSASCTHLGCTVQYRPDLHEIWCPCHNGIYNLNGGNVSGPPPRPLTVFDVHVRGDEIYVSQKAQA